MSCSNGYQQEQAGPFGYTMNGEIQRMAQLNASFDQLAWENAKLDGCMQAPCREYPLWPPPPETGFIYPSLEKITQPTLLGEEKGPGAGSAPYMEARAYRPNEMHDIGSTKKYTPDEILNDSDCNFPVAMQSALPGSDWQPTPMDYTTSNPMYVREIEGNWIPKGKYSNNIGNTANNACLAEKMSLPLRNGVSVETSEQPPMQPSIQSNNGKKKSTGSALDVIKEQTTQSTRPVGNTFNNFASTDMTPTGDNNPNNPNASPTSGDDGTTVNILSIQNNSGSYCSTTTNDVRCLRYNLRHLFPCMLNAIRGIMYDLSFWEDLPDTNNSKLVWIFTRDDRMFYLATLVLIVLVIYLGLQYIWKTLEIQTQLNYTLLLALCAFILYFMTPDANQDNQLAKGIAVAAIVVVGVCVYNLWKNRTVIM